MTPTSGPQNTAHLQLQYAKYACASLLSAIRAKTSHIPLSLCHPASYLGAGPIEAKNRSCGRSNPGQTLSCLLQPAGSMATYGYKRRFILLDNPPQISGRTGTNPHIQCSICGFQFYGGTSRQKWHLRRIPGNGIRICSEIEAKAPELVAELEREVQQEQRQKELEQKRAASSSSASAPIVRNIQISHAGSEQIFQKDAGSCCQLWCRLSATQQ